jgi:hypothetical protein
MFLPAVKRNKLDYKGDLYLPIFDTFRLKDYFTERFTEVMMGIIREKAEEKAAISERIDLIQELEPLRLPLDLDSELEDDIVEFGGEDRSLTRRRMRGRRLHSIIAANEQSPTNVPVLLNLVLFTEESSSINRHHTLFITRDVLSSLIAH